jgi:1-acyl-sn-glycerol-3-phosphate acyltransferase
VTRITRRIGAIAWAAWAWCVFGTVTLVALLLLAVLPGETRRRRLLRAGTRLIATLSGVPLRITGLDGLPPGPCVVVANHASYLDGVILTAALPPRFAFVVKREMSAVPLAHFLLRRIGTEFVDRELGGQGTRDTRRILEQARGGQPLVFFPEGTFQAAPGLNRFRLGAFNAALRGEMPVVPVIIQGSRAMLPAGCWMPRRGGLSVHIQPPVEANVGERSVDLAARCRAIMLADLGEPDLDADAPPAWPGKAASA